MKTKPVKMIYAVILISLWIILVLTLASAFGVPRKFQIFVVQTASMEPNIPTGSLLVVSPAATYNRGDVITFRGKLEKDGPKDYTITHRISNIYEDNGDIFYETKGDANKDVDPAYANRLDVIGKVKFSFPLIGYVVGFIKTPIGYLSFVVVPAVVIVYREILSIFTEWEKVRASKRRYGTISMRGRSGSTWDLYTKQSKF